MLLELAGRHPLLRNDLHARGQADSGLVVDARRLRFASPLDLAGIAALTHTRADAGGSTELVLPADTDVASYIQRMDLIERLPPDTRIVGALPLDDRRDRSSTLLETSILTSGTANAVGERIGRLATAGLGAKAGARAARSIGELIDNAVSHGQGHPGAFIAAQVYTGKTTRYRRLEVAVCDPGVGVLGHLRRNPEYKDTTDSAQALRRALKPGVTGTSEQRGHGLPDLLAHAGLNGPTRLVLRSGDGLLRVGRLLADASTVQSHTSSTWVDGTWTWLRVSFTP
ncbi:hypothetical protein [Streptomyces sp. NRRL F-525]|uniref:hypothetical protein n=1 Tax=Streptomyces sp. NRRL F-525 TaxID=1463861 RepID=UPI0005274D23|nr:hypothetical protein [Streptomyces sp. NRRL F-525]